MTVIILALLVVDLALTAIMMFSVTSTAKKTANIVDQIAAVLNLELEPSTGETETPQISITDTAFYDLPQMTIILAPTEGDSKTHAAIVTVTVWMNTKHADYKETGAAVAGGTYDSAIQPIINSIISRCDYATASGSAGQDAICASILKEVQSTFGSDFVYNISLKSIMTQ